MAGPLAPLAIPGIEWLAGIIGALFASLFSFFLKFFSKRIAITLAVIAGVVAITAAFFAAIVGLIEGLQVAVPVPIQQGMALLLPANTIACLTAIITGHVLRFGYDWQVRVIQYKLFS